MTTSGFPRRDRLSRILGGSILPCALASWATVAATQALRIVYDQDALVQELTAP
jgi:hypothetical protein